MKSFLAVMCVFVMVLTIMFAPEVTTVKSDDVKVPDGGGIETPIIDF